MNTATDTLTFLRQRLSACVWKIVRTVGWGLLAVALAAYGQQCLSEAYPIFPLIRQNYGIWQCAYALVLALLGVGWLAAMSQGINAFQEYAGRVRVQRRIEEQRAARAHKAQLARQEREAAASTPTPMRGGRGNKFDY